jgi:hemerythrin-like domain-containing protein
MAGIGVLHTIGQPHIPNFADPLGLMSHCHRKIEGFLLGLAASSEILRNGRADKLAEAFRMIDAAREHFALRGFKHTEDEEASLFPRMRDYGGTEAVKALETLARLESDHRQAEETHAELDALIDLLPRNGFISGEQLALYDVLVSELIGIYQPHIQIEDQVIFPTAARVLPPEVLKTIGEEMRMRRRELLANPRSASEVVLTSRN